LGLLAVGGGIAISRRVARERRNHSQWTVRDGD
jgi:hypothetical protein